MADAVMQDVGAVDADGDVQMEDAEEEIYDLRSADVTAKYKEAAAICQAALTAVVQAALPSVKILDLCNQGDAIITELAGKLYKKKKIDKGIAFPTCISPNHIVGHFSPLQDDTTVLAAGDAIKIELGAHMDGYVACIAHTFVVPAAPNTPPTITGNQANVMAAVNTAAEAALRLLRPGKKASELTEAFTAIGKDFGVQPIANVLSNPVARFVLDSTEKAIVMAKDPETKVKDFDIEPDTAYCIDLLYSSGSGKPQECDTKHTVYKRDTNSKYHLSMKASREVFSDITQHFPHFAFTTRAIGKGGAKERMGIAECYQHELLQQYTVRRENVGDAVAHVKMTVLVTKHATERITGVPPVPVQTDKKITDPKLIALLAEPVLTKKKRKKKRKK